MNLTALAKRSLAVTSSHCKSDSFSLDLEGPGRLSALLGDTSLSLENGRPNGTGTRAIVAKGP